MKSKIVKLVVVAIVALTCAVAPVMSLVSAQPDLAARPAKGVYDGGGSSG
jgi:hypothetical protein